MGKIIDNDVEEICKQFDALEYTHSRRIAITDLARCDKIPCSEAQHDDDDEASHGTT